MAALLYSVRAAGLNSGRLLLLTELLLIAEVPTTELFETEAAGSPEQEQHHRCLSFEYHHVNSDSSMTGITASGRGECVVIGRRRPFLRINRRQRITQSHHKKLRCLVGPQCFHQL